LTVALRCCEAQAVIDAATSCLGLRAYKGATLVGGDALTWVRDAAAALQTNPAADSAGAALPAQAQFDAIFVDVYDADNVTPPPFYSEAFLADCRALLAPGGALLQNLHTGNAALDTAFTSAASAYSRAFPGGAAAVPVWGQGNTIVCASCEASVFSGRSAAGVQRAAEGEAAALGLATFDVAQRLVEFRALGELR